jgi:hypothetical protein
VDLVPELAYELDRLDTPFDLPQLQSVITSAILGLDRQIWLFIDALDECREGDVQELIDFVNGLQEAQLYGSSTAVCEAWHLICQGSSSNVKPRSSYLPKKSAAY